jgi:heme-degrading monooxygenase HmoA
MYVRVNRFQEHADDLDEASRIAEDELVPQLQSIPGFAGVLSLIDRATGESLALTFWETEEAMRASEAAADRVRADAQALTGSEIRTIQRYEVALRVGL